MDSNKIMKFLISVEGISVPPVLNLDLQEREKWQNILAILAVADIKFVASNGDEIPLIPIKFLTRKEAL